VWLSQIASKQVILGSLSTVAVLLTVGIASMTLELPHLTIVLLAASLTVTSLLPQ
jgi:hypothetical protein